MINYFNDILSGLSTIRAMHQIKNIEHSLYKKIMLSVNSYYTLKAGDRWLQVRLELLATAVYYIFIYLFICIRFNLLV